jgi:hypothetical protein
MARLRAMGLTDAAIAAMHPWQVAAALGERPPPEAQTATDLEKLARLLTRSNHKLKVPQLPEPRNFMGWKSQLRESLIGTSPRDAASIIAWIGQVDAAPASAFYSFEDPGREMENLDYRLRDALKELSMPAPLRQRINQASDELARSHRGMSGRQMLHIIYRYFDVSQPMSHAMQMSELTGMKFVGDDGLEGFLNRWTALLSEMGQNKPNEGVLADMLHTKLTAARPSSLEMDMATYDRMPVGHPDRTHTWLLLRIREACERRRTAANTQSLMKSNDPRPPRRWGERYTSAAAHTGGAASKAQTKPCKFFNTRMGCRLGNSCTFRHEQPVAAAGTPSAATGSAGGPPGGKGSGKGGKGKGKKGKRGRSGSSSKDSSRNTSRSPSANSRKPLTPAEKKQRACFYEARGKCDKGASCEYSHDPKLIAEQKRRNEERKGKGKGGWRSRSGSRGASVGRSPPPGPRKGGNIACREFASKGSCKFGSSCKFSHASPGGARS